MIENWPPKEIASKSASWHGNQTDQGPGGEQHLVAQYAFNEGSGQVVHGVPGAAPDLYIPKIFKVPHKKMLMWPWEESHDKLEFRDIAINIFGFVPFGFVFAAYLTWESEREALAAHNDSVRRCHQFDDRNPAGIHPWKRLRNTGHHYQYVGNVFRGTTISLGSNAEFSGETSGFSSIRRTNIGELIGALRGTLLAVEP